MIDILLFVLGVIIGSFLNAVIWRMKVGKSIVRGRSQCIHCDRSLQAQDLVPLFSFFIQRGSCRYCQKKISWQYPLVECATGLIFVLVWQMGGHIGGSACAMGSWCEIIRILLNLFAVSVLIILFVLDFRYFILPSNLSITAASIIFLVNLALGVSWYNLIVAAAIGFSFFALQYIVSRGAWVGDGDMYMGALIGTIVGFPKIFSALLISYVLGALAAVVLLVTGRATRGSKLPMGTFLAVGTAIVMLWAP